jgi:hypothetical protein
VFWQAIVIAAGRMEVQIVGKMMAPNVGETAAAVAQVQAHRRVLAVVGPIVQVWVISTLFGAMSMVKAMDGV